LLKASANAHKNSIRLKSIIGSNCRYLANIMPSIQKIPGHNNGAKFFCIIPPQKKIDTFFLDYFNNFL